MVPERRTVSRRQWQGPGTVVLGRSGKTTPCDIVNLSGSGALIEFETHRLMPLEFDLVAQGMISFRSRLVWSDGRTAGIAFDGWPADHKRDPKIVRIPSRV